MKQTIATILVVLLAACSVDVSPQEESSQSTRVAEAVSTLMPQSSTPVPEPTDISSPLEPKRFSVLLLGIDKGFWRDSDPRRPHSDYMVVVVVEPRGETAKISLVQIPRNVFIPLPNIPDDFAFGLYSEGGLGMIEGWVEQALGIPLIGAVALRMDDFILLINDLGGLTVGGTHYTGEQLLYYVRFHLFDTDSYDPEGIHFEVLEALADKMRQKLSDPESAFGLVIRYLPLVETDLDPGGMVDFLFSQGLPLVQGKYSIERVRLEEVLCYEDIPFENPGTSKGLLVCDGINLHEWVQSELK